MLRLLTPEATAVRLRHREKLQRRRHQRRWKPQSAVVLRWGPGEAAAEVVNYVCNDKNDKVCEAFQTTDEFSESAIRKTQCVLDDKNNGDVQNNGKEHWTSAATRLSSAIRARRRCIHCPRAALY